VVVANFTVIHPTQGYVPRGGHESASQVTLPLLTTGVPSPVGTVYVNVVALGTNATSMVLPA